MLPAVSGCCLDLINKSLAFWYAAVMWWSSASAKTTVRIRWWNNKLGAGGPGGRLRKLQSVCSVLWEMWVCAAVCLKCTDASRFMDSSYKPTWAYKSEIKSSLIHKRQNWWKSCNHRWRTASASHPRNQTVRLWLKDQIPAGSQILCITNALPADGMNLKEDAHSAL